MRTLTRGRGSMILMLVAATATACGDDGGSATIDGGGGGGDGGGGGGPDAGVPPAPIACDDAGDLPTPSGPAYYVSDCQPGAAAGCVPGDDGNDGLSMASPKRTLAGLDVNALPAGAQILFARGGAWADFFVQIENPNVTAAAPLFLDAYGTGPAPLLRASAGTLLEFGRLNSPLDDGGYVVRNLHLRGEGQAQWGVWIRETVHDLWLDSLEIEGFDIGVHVQSAAMTPTDGVTGLRLRRSNVHHNHDMGMLGNYNDSVIECNQISFNNESGSGFNHGIYMGGGGTNVVIRNNQMVENSVVGGTCTGGNLTAHGQWSNVLVEGNTITQQQSNLGCYGLSITSGYLEPEALRQFTLRGNRIINLGCAVCVSAAPGIVIENNTIINATTGGQGGVSIGPADGDDEDTVGAVIRNNTIHLRDGAGISLGTGTGALIHSNLVVHAGPGGGNRQCFYLPTRGQIGELDYNLCDVSGGGTWGAGYDGLAQAQAAGLDVHGVAAPAGLAATPGPGNDWSDALAATSAAVDAGDPARSSSTDRVGVARTTPDIGAREYVAP